MVQASDNNIRFFEWYFDSKLRQKDEFFPLSELSKMTALSKLNLFDDAKLRLIEIWCKVPENAEVRTFPIKNVLLSEIKTDLDYLTPVLADQSSSNLAWMGEDSVVLSVGTPHPVDFLLVSFQDIRWHATGSVCIFMRGVTKINEEEKNLEESEHNLLWSDFGDYRLYDAANRQNDMSGVFVTCNVHSEEDNLLILDERRVKRLPINEMDLYVNKSNLKSDGFFKKIADEMECHKIELLNFLDLENIEFINFPEKLFYIFVITRRNINRMNVGENISRTEVKDDLLLLGFEDKPADTIATLIVNIRGSKDKKKENLFVLKDDSRRDVVFGKLKVVEIFWAFKKFYKKGEKIKSEAVKDYLENECGYKEEPLIRTAPIVAGTDKDESWAGYPLIVS